MNYFIQEIPYGANPREIEIVPGEHHVETIYPAEPNNNWRFCLYSFIRFDGTLVYAACLDESLSALMPKIEDTDVRRIAEDQWPSLIELLENGKNNFWAEAALIQSLDADTQTMKWLAVAFVDKAFFHPSQSIREIVETTSPQAYYLLQRVREIHIQVANHSL